VTGEPWGYTNWGTGEPNDAWPTGEDRLQIHLNGFWNDEPRHFLVGGYLIEYEAAPTHADLYVSAINDVPTLGRPDQVTISVGDCVTLTYRVKFRVGAFVDVTHSENTSFFTSPARGIYVSGNVWCPTEADRNKVITLYARYFSPLTGIGIGDTVIVYVRR
jgi:hypothetical protein